MFFQIQKYLTNVKANVSIKMYSPDAGEGHKISKGSRVGERPQNKLSDNKRQAEPSKVLLSWMDEEGFLQTKQRGSKHSVLEGLETSRVTFSQEPNH